MNCNYSDSAGVENRALAHQYRNALRIYSLSWPIIDFHKAIQWSHSPEQRYASSPLMRHSSHNAHNPWHSSRQLGLYVHILLDFIILQYQVLPRLSKPYFTLIWLWGVFSIVVCLWRLAKCSFQGQKVLEYLGHEGKGVTRVWLCLPPLVGWRDPAFSYESSISVRISIGLGAGTDHWH